MTVKADYKVMIVHQHGVANVTLPGLTDEEYRLLRSMELRVNSEVGYRLMKFYQITEGGEA